MKKLLTLAVLSATVVGASAATLKWGWGQGSLFVAESGKTTGTAAAGFDTSKGDTSSISLVLVYLGSSSSFTASDITAGNVIDTIAFGYDGDTEESFWSPDTKSIAITETGGYSAGDYFGVAYTVNGEYKLISDIADWDSGTLGDTIAPVVQMTDLAVNKSAMLYASSSQFTTDSAAAVFAAPVTDPGPGPGPGTIPEPATGALALAGVALLFKRRRA